LHSSSVWVEHVQLFKRISTQHYHLAFGNRKTCALGMRFAHAPLASHMSTLGLCPSNAGSQGPSNQLHLEPEDTVVVCYTVTKEKVS